MFCLDNPWRICWAMPSSAYRSDTKRKKLVWLGWIIPSITAISQRYRERSLSGFIWAQSSMEQVLPTIGVPYLFELMICVFVWRSQEAPAWVLDKAKSYLRSASENAIVLKVSPWCSCWAGPSFVYQSDTRERLFSCYSRLHQDSQLFKAIPKENLGWIQLSKESMGQGVSPE